MIGSLRRGRGEAGQLHRWFHIQNIDGMFFQSLAYKSLKPKNQKKEFLSFTHDIYKKKTIPRFTKRDAIQNFAIQFKICVIKKKKKKLKKLPVKCHVPNAK